MKTNKANVVALLNGGEFELGDGECLVIINDDSAYRARTPSDVIACIADHSFCNGIITFIVKDLGAGKVIGDVNDICLDTARVLRLSIAKHHRVDLQQFR